MLSIAPSKVRQSPRSAREAAGLTLDEVIARSGLHRATVQKIEENRKAVNYQSADRYAMAIGVEWCDLSWRVPPTDAGKTPGTGVPFNRRQKEVTGAMCDGCHERKSLTGECWCV